MGLTLRRTGACGAVMLLVLLAPAVPAAAQESRCVVFVGDRLATDFSSWRDPLVLDRDDALQLIGRSPEPVDRISVRVVLPLASREVWDAAFASPRQAWAGAAVLSDIADVSTGLHHLEIRAGSCRLGVWVDVGGRSALTTPVGLLGIAMLALGVAGLALALRAAVRGRRRLGRSALSGAVGGVGALLLANQLGQVPLTTEWLTSWLLLPAGVGAVLDLAIGSAAGPAAGPAVGDTPGGPPAGAAPMPRSARRFPTPSPSRPPSTANGGSRRRADLPESVAPAEAAPEHVGPDTGEVPVVVGSDTAGAEPPSTEADPPRSSHALLQAPEAVIAAIPFRITVGLSPEAVPGVAGQPLVRPPTSVGAYDLTVQLVADGFTIADADARRVLHVTATAPYPTFDAELVAQPADAGVAARSIQAIYSIDGQTIGFAVRPIAVVADASLLGSRPAPPVAEPAVVGVPTPEHAADVTIHVVMGADEPGRLLWTVAAADPRLTLPAQALSSNIGTDPETFARKLIHGVSRYDGQVGIVPFLRGAGLSIAEHVPIEITDVLRSAAALVGDRPLTVFLVSEEPYVPWELAVVEPVLRSDAPPFLAAQVELGRWVLGQRRPTLPPPLAVQVDAMAVIGGVYDGTAQRLVEAEAEAAALAERYGAVAVDARVADIIDCLGGRPAAEVLHFAVHGMYDATGVKEGLVLLDGSLLDPLQVKGALVLGAPFVFLNACQVGSGNELLGDYAGVAHSFLYAGAAAVIAPLWSVSDAIARELALAFYEATFEEGARPAAVLREMRARFDDEAAGAAATFLAYQFFGHPNLKLARSGA